MKRSNQRVVGLDVHPDSFAGAILEGGDPASAKVLRTSTRVALEELEGWARRHTETQDVLVLEASGNAFKVAQRLRGQERNVVILDSHQAGKSRQGLLRQRSGRCDQDRAHLSERFIGGGLAAGSKDAGTARSLQRLSGNREREHAAQTTIKSMLNEHCVRLEKGFRLSHPSAIARLLKLRTWTPVQAMLLAQLHTGLVAARVRRQKLRHYMAKEVLDEVELLRLARLCGLSLITIYGLSAAIGDITRFAHSKKLVAYLGLNPSVCQSGNYEGGTALKRHGRGALRALLIQSAKKLLQVSNPLQKWGLAVAARRGRNKAAVAVARKLCVAVWHVMKGHAIGAIERMDTLHTKLGKLATELGVPAIKALGYETKEAFVQKKLYLLRTYP